MIPTCFIKTLLPEEFGPVSTAIPLALQSLGTKLCVVSSVNMCLSQKSLFITEYVDTFHCEYLE